MSFTNEMHCIWRRFDKLLQTMSRINVHFWTKPALQGATRDTQSYDKKFSKLFTAFIFSNAEVKSRFLIICCRANHKAPDISISNTSRRHMITQFEKSKFKQWMNWNVAKSYRHKTLLLKPKNAFL